MAGHAKEVDSATAWGGDGSPFRISYGKQMMWFFLLSDALTFGGLLCAYGYFRHQYGTWPVGEEVFDALPFLGNGYPLMYVALMTFILIVSSVTMVLAVEAGHRLDKKGVIKWLTLTVIGGVFFVGSQAWEWYHFIHGSHFGATLTADGWATIKAGFRLLPSTEGKNKSSAFQIFFYSFAMIPIGILPCVQLTPDSSPICSLYGLIVLVPLGIMLAIPALKLYRTMEDKYAKQLMFASFIYLPVAQLAYYFFKL